MLRTSYHPGWCLGKHSGDHSMNGTLYILLLHQTRWVLNSACARTHTHTDTHISKYTNSCSDLPTQSYSYISVLSPAEIILPSGNTHIITAAYAQSLSEIPADWMPLWPFSVQLILSVLCKLASSFAVTTLNSVRADHNFTTGAVSETCYHCWNSSSGGDEEALNFL